MAKKIIRGLLSIKIGPVAGDGTMGTVLEEVGYTVNDTAIMSTAEGTKNDFFVEEQDEPIESVETAKGSTTLAWSSNNMVAAVMLKYFGGAIVSGTNVGGINVFGAVTGGSAYTNGTYTDVPLTGGAGTGARATVVVAGGAVTTVTKTAQGQGYAAGTPLSAAAVNIGGTGTGFLVAVTSVYAAYIAETWEAPAVVPEIEGSIEVKDRKLNMIQIVRAKIAPRLTMNLRKTTLGQIDFVATLLAPTANVGAWKITYGTNS